jgi:Protein of unknown function (DUF3352)
VRRATICGGALALAVLGAGCGSTSTTAGSASSIVPATVSAYIAIDSDPASAQWQTADDLARRFPDKQKGVDALERGLRKASGLDFERDIKPALGPEIDMVWLDLDHGGSDVVALMQPPDEAAFERAVAKGNASDPSSPLVYEKVGEWEVMSDRRSKIAEFKAMTSRGGATLADDPTFSHAMSEYSDDALVKAYVSGAQVMDKARASLPADATKLLDKLGTLDWVAASVRVTPDGVRLDTTVRGRPGSILQNGSAGKGGSSFEPSLPNLIPHDALAYIAFHGVGDTFSAIQSNPALASPELAPVRGLLRKLGKLVQGEDALYVRRGDGRIPEVTLVTEPSPGADGAATLDRILAGTTNLQARMERSQVAGVEARTLALGGNVGLHYANVGSNLVVSDLVSGIADLANGGPGLAQSATYSDALRASGAPSKVAGFLYVDVHGGLDLVQRLSNAPIPAGVTRNLGPLRSAVAYAASRPSEVQVTLFLRVG